MSNVLPADIVADALLSLRRKNPAYSLSAFARDVGISKSLLSRVLSKKRTLTLKQGLQIAAALRFGERRRTEFVRLIVESAPEGAKISRSLKEKILSGGSPSDSSPSTRSRVLNYRTVDTERFAMMQNWHHLAVLHLIETKGFRNDPAWISKRLRIQRFEAEDALKRLLFLRLIHEVDGRLVPTNDHFHFATDKSHLAIRSFHRGMIDRAKQALNDPSKEAYSARLINGITFSCPKSKVEWLKEEIDRFEDRILDVLKAEPECEEVYQMNVQLFPLTVPVPPSTKE